MKILKSYLGQCFQTSVYIQIPRDFDKTDSWVLAQDADLVGWGKGWRKGLRTCISNKHPDDASATLD